MSLALTVAAGASGDLDFPITYDGRAKKLRYRLYQGNQLSLQLRPVVLRREEEIDLVRYPANGKTYLDGDSEDATLEIDHGLEAQVDVLRIKYKNTDLTNPYDFRVDVSIWRGL